MSTRTTDDARAPYAPSGLLPTDPFDVALRDLTGLPDGAHTQPTTVTETDDYGHTCRYIVQTVRWANGNTVFIERTSPPARFVLPPKVTAAIARQAEAVSAMLRRRHGKRLAAERKAAGVALGGFTPEMRRKAAATRKRKAAARRARKAGQ